jgi:hypothetical protein
LKAGFRLQASSSGFSTRIQRSKHFLKPEARSLNYNLPMYHYDPATALEELTEEAILPNPVRVRDMILRRRLTPEHSLELNRLFVEYQKFFGEAQKLGKEILKQLAG